MNVLGGIYYVVIPVLKYEGEPSIELGVALHASESRKGSSRNFITDKVATTDISLKLSVQFSKVYQKLRPLNGLPKLDSPLLMIT